MNKDSPFYIASFDGGGVRGLASLEFTLKFEEHMKKMDNTFKIYEFFDMFAGTSAGGILAGLIAYGKMEMSDISKVYGTKALKEIFKQSCWDRVFGRFQDKPVYDGKAKTRILKEALGPVKFNDPIPGTHVVIPTFDLVHRARIFYSGDPENGNITAANVIDATSAAPTYFPGVRIKDSICVDGGIIANNPTMCAITQAKKILAKRGTPERNIVVVNFGTGSYQREVNLNDAKNYGGIQWLFNDIISLPYDESLVQEQAEMSTNVSYMRICGPLNDIDKTLDNTKDDHLQELIKLGQAWWYEFSDKLMEHLRNHPFIKKHNLIQSYLGEATEDLKNIKKSSNSANEKLESIPRSLYKRRTMPPLPKIPGSVNS